LDTPSFHPLACNYPSASKAFIFYLVEPL